MHPLATQVGLAKLSGEPHNFHLLTVLAIILCVATVTTVVFQRLRQPVVLGYLLVGLYVISKRT
jgi:Kef-type K+ transport system membrane component KefB